jgi:hypothetical protein
MQKQIEELKLYFDTDFITDKTKLITQLTPSEFTNIKLKIKSERKDGAYAISDRIFIQMMNQEVFIYDTRC